MAVTRLNQTTGHGNGGGPFTSGTFNSTNGSSIVVCIREAEGQAGTQAPTDNSGSTFNQIGTTQGSNGGGVQVRNYLAVNITGRSGHQITVDYSGASTGDPSFAVIEYGSVLTASVLDVSVQNFDSSSPYDAIASGTLAQADEVIVHTVGINNGGTVAYSWTAPFSKVSDEQDGNNYWTGGVGEQIVSATTTQTPSCSVTGGNQAACHVFSLKGGGAPTTFDRAESSAGTEAEDRTLAITGAGAESSAGTESPNRTIAVATGATESAAGTDSANRSLALPGAVAESSAGTEAEDRSLGTIAAAGAETSAGTEAQDRVVTVGPFAVAESSAGTTAQDETPGLNVDVAESSAGTTAQDATFALPGAVAETSAGTTAQNGTLAFTGAVAESAAGTTAQDYTPGASADVAESSTPSTAQDRSTPTLPAMAVAESSTPGAAQDRLVTPPPGAGSSGTRRWVVQYYEDYFARKEREKRELEEAAKPKGKKTRAKRQTAKIIADVPVQAQQAFENVFNVQRDREQAELDEDEVLLLSAL